MEVGSARRLQTERLFPFTQASFRCSTFILDSSMSPDHDQASGVG
jgi:hypothetical protein